MPCGVGRVMGERASNHERYADRSRAPHARCAPLLRSTSGAASTPGRRPAGRWRADRGRVGRAEARAYIFGCGTMMPVVGILARIRRAVAMTGPRANSQRRRESRIRRAVAMTGPRANSQRRRERAGYAGPWRWRVQSKIGGDRSTHSAAARIPRFRRGMVSHAFCLAVRQTRHFATAGQQSGAGLRRECRA
jgi:hypothetical protein